MKNMITSVQNQKVKYWKKLQKRKGRIKAGMFLIEGYHLIEEAKRSNWDIHEIIIKEDQQVPDWCMDFTIEKVNKTVFHHIAQTESPQGIIAVVKMNQTECYPGNYMLLIDAVQDPGNLGTMIRTADAAGFDAIILGEGTVDVYNDKVIRSTQGSLFHIPVLQRNLLETISILKKEGFRIWASALSGAEPYNQIEVEDKVALIIGNEGAGIQDTLLHEADSIVNIPIYGRAESLNASIAAGILMYYIRG
ncbi:TrmH family RNA methyltransferase [Virgibacillus alimentarius]|uniref:TrmH family RNA methyltransferase n=1 Tax=Virgibacillus alimentarius TaxID=698769 RepID=A0ABS4S5B7_9BACI|nr:MULTISPECIES: RNA methyltransferase [Virgibacillus]MBP2256692.1 TrmH family RNA methyltransferase [Virgibacillus alimentarius]HLR67154.1 RNA methyltransferase [Virgibacillus sp.]